MPMSSSSSWSLVSNKEKLKMKKIRFGHHLKLLPMIMWILFSGIIQNFSYCDEPENNSDSLVRGAKAWADNCSRCHNMRSPSEFSAKQWQTIVLHMRLQAGLSGENERDIYNFLAAQSPKPNQAQPVSQTVSTEQAGTNAQSSSKTPPTSSTSINNIELGKKIYHQTCVVCHGANGKGAISGVLDLTGKNSPLLKNSDAVLLQRIEQGYQESGSPLAMPPKGGNPNLSSEDLKAVLEYMKQTFGH